MDDINCVDLLNDLAKYMSNNQLTHFRQWIGADAALSLTEESCILAREWVDSCTAKTHKAYEQLPDDDDIGKLTAKDWETIRDNKVLELLWKKVLLNRTHRRQVRKMARPGQPKVKWYEAVRDELSELKINRKEIETGQLESDVTEGLCVLQEDAPGKLLDLFPLFKAYVFYNSCASIWVRLKWGLGKIGITVDDIRTNAGKWWQKLVTDPQVLTATAFCFLAVAFAALAMDFDRAVEIYRNHNHSFLILFIGILIITLGVYWQQRGNSIPILLVLLVLGYALFATWVIFPELFPSGIIPTELQSPTWILVISSSALFLALLSIVKLKSIREHYVILLLVGLISAALLEWLIGLIPAFIARSVAAIFSSLVALWLLHRTGSAPVKRAQTPPLRHFLEQVTDGRSWSQPLEKWRWPNGLLFTILFLLALILFFSLFTSKQNPSCSTNDAQIQVIYPSWLSDRDQATLYVTTTFTEPVTAIQRAYLEPIKNGQLFLREVEATAPDLPAPAPIPTRASSQPITATTTSSQPATRTTHARWEICTLPPKEHWGLADWQFRVSLVDKTSGKMEYPQDCTISIARLKLPFGLRGFLEIQPLVTLVGILYGLAQTTIQLWVGERAFGDGNRQKGGNTQEKTLVVE